MTPAVQWTRTPMYQSVARKLTAEPLCTATCRARSLSYKVHFGSHTKPLTVTHGNQQWPRSDAEAPRCALVPQLVTRLMRFIGLVH